MEAHAPRMAISFHQAPKITRIKSTVFPTVFPPEIYISIRPRNFS